MSNRTATASSVKTSEAKQKKIDTVKELSDKVGRAKAIILADYRGLKHKQLEELRKTLKKVEGEFVITKNRLLRRSLGDKTQTLDSSLSDTTATLFAYNDEIAPLKELLKFFKAAGVGKSKAGLLGGSPLTEAEVTRLALLPTKNVLLGQLVGQLNAPIQGLHYALSWNMNTLVWALNNIKDQKLKIKN